MLRADGYELFRERSHSRSLVVLDVKYRIELRDLQKVVDFLREVQQFQLATFLADGRECADQFADTGAVNVGHVSQVQQDLLFAFAKDFADGVSQDHAAFAKSDAAT